MIECLYRIPYLIYRSLHYVKEVFDMDMIITPSIVLDFDSYVFYFARAITLLL